MKVGSTFSGVGGLDLGLERAGMNVVWQAEIDEWCRSVLKFHWPRIPIYQDVRDVNDSAEAIDILVGGFPCQDLSLAGRRAGLEGEKSGLFFEFARICSEIRPQWFLLENVGGLLSSSDGRDFGIVLSEMASLGYGISWRVLDARFFGVPQRRRRVFIVGCLGDDGCQRAVRALGTGREGDLEAGECSWQSASRKSRDSAQGNNQEIAKCLTTSNQRFDPDYETFIVKSVAENQRGEVRESDTAQILASGGKPGQGHPVVHYPEINVTQSLTTRFGTTGVDYADAEAGFVQEFSSVVRRLTPLECERLMSWPDNWTKIDGDKTPDGKRYSACGNGVVSNVSEWIGRRIMAVHNE